MGAETMRRLQFIVENSPHLVNITIVYDNEWNTNELIDFMARNTQLKKLTFYAISIYNGLCSRLIERFPQWKLWKETHFSDCRMLLK